MHFGSAGVGSASHLTGELFNSMARTKIVHIGYKGAGPALIDVSSGQIPMMFATLATVHPMVHARKLVLIAVTTQKRTRTMPEVPTVAESGVPGFSMRSWNGLLGPSGLPKAIIRRLSAEVLAALDSAELSKRLLAVGFEPDPTTADEFAQFIKDELALHARIVKMTGIRID
jgi:tripartite-type tricarboxylate transporter receptor subunit TctC